MAVIAYWSEQHISHDLNFNTCGKIVVTHFKFQAVVSSLKLDVLSWKYFENWSILLKHERVYAKLAVIGNLCSSYKMKHSKGKRICDQRSHRDKKEIKFEIPEDAKYMASLRIIFDYWVFIGLHLVESLCQQKPALNFLRWGCWYIVYRELQTWL